MEVLIYHIKYVLEQTNILREAAKKVFFSEQASSPPPPRLSGQKKD